MNHYGTLATLNQSKAARAIREADLDAAIAKAIRKEKRTVVVLLTLFPGVGRKRIARIKKEVAENG